MRAPWLSGIWEAVRAFLGVVGLTICLTASGSSLAGQVPRNIDGAIVPAHRPMSAILVDTRLVPAWYPPAQQLYRQEAQTAINILQSLIGYGNQHHWLVYEYAAALDGLQHALAQTKTSAQYQIIIDQVQIQITNLRAMLANYRDQTPADQSHMADRELLQTYGLYGKVIVISLGEQVARMYDNSRLVDWSYITTGRQGAATPSGLWHIYQKNSPIYYLSPDPPGSPLYFRPTLVQYSLAYHPGGYFLHDAWWRHQFGPGTNLPHHDPAAFNGGSHGCVNFPTVAAKWLYNWAPIGTPVIVY